MIDTLKYANYEAHEKKGEFELVHGASYLELKEVGSNGKRTLSVDHIIINARLFPKKNLLVILYEDNHIEFFDLKYLQKVLNVVLEGEGEWFAYTDQGYYASSLHGADHVYLSVGDVQVQVRDAAAHMERPGLIASQLRSVLTGDANNMEADHHIIVQGSKEMFLSPYKMELLSLHRSKTSDSEYIMKVRVRVEKADSASPSVGYMHNGRSFSARGIKIKPVKESALSYLFEQTFQLEDGVNAMRAWVDVQGLRVSPVEAFIEKTIQPAAVHSATGNDIHLWYFGVGVSKYDREEMNLDFADADALSLGKALKKQAGKLFREVHVKVLSNREAGARSVKVEMNKFLRQASSNDVILIFLAGHGVQDSDQTLYFMPSDGDYAVPYSGIDVAEFNRFLRNRPRNQKALLWIDICHAGALGNKDWKTRGRLSSADVIQELANGTGIGVLASSTGRESSLESKDFSGGHGAFTAALLKALAGDADKKSGNGDGVVSLLELQSYVSRYVPKITGGRQHPTSPEMSNLRDFPVAVSF